jgi:PAS domain S-box-containing protein
MSLEQENSELRQRVAQLESVLSQVQSVLNLDRGAVRDGDSSSVVKLKAELQNSEALFRAYVETANDMVYRVDLAGQLTYMNAYGQQILQCGSDGWRGRSYMEFITPECREATARAFAKLLTQGELKDFEFTLQPLNGELVHMQVNGCLLYQNGKPIGGMGIARNITERKRFEQQLQMFRKAVESAYDSATIVALDGTIMYVNPATNSMFGYEADAAIGQNATIFYPEDARSQIQWLLQQVMLSGKTTPRSQKLGYPACLLGGWSREVMCQRQNGERFPALVSIGPIPDEMGRPTAISLICRDITTQKQTQQELATKNLALEQASQHKSAFLANMSHELRTPLSSILGFSSVLLQQIYGSLNNKQSEYIQRIHRSGQHLLHLINDLLDLSKLEAGKVRLEIGPVEVTHLCNSTLELLSDQIEGKGLKLNVSIQNNLAPLMADEQRVRQMLINLLSNAIKFSPNGGEIGLQVKTEGDRLLLVVWDRGMGIPEDKQGLLFQPFQQIESSWGRSHEGTGLGLALTQQLAGLHGGTVECYSQFGHGCQFTIALPLSLQQNSRKLDQMESRQSLRSSAKTAKSHLLLVEDRQDNAMLLQDILQHWGYQVHHAANGEDALAWLESHHPDLILMDVQLPGIDGLEVTRQIKAHSTWKSIPIIATTAMAMVGDLDRCFEAGMDDYLSKPVNCEQLSIILTKHLHDRDLSHQKIG